ncbi:hypothetical protein PBY51_005755 [Eleginops maclovinus]|uniref:Ig-like domain-containing protein n=1 Tax=Eleginops maclovinus TaxID=56733 RepID=A0AAN7WVQ4_ELEMC|nr:hypothetical protein PBY51_005755 [Eleginops maclovinus]
MQLTPLCLMLSCLRVSPDQSQFFRYDSFSLSCEDRLYGTDWTLKRKTSVGGVRPCSSGWGTTALGASCDVGTPYPSDTGVYWCESGDGRRSNNSINITITDRPVLLKCPTLPVLGGSDATLRCQAETFSSEHTFHFLKDGRLISSSLTGEMTIRGVSQSDEGLYSCSIRQVGESVGSWLSVEGSTSAPTTDCCLVSVPRLMCHLVVGTPFLLSTILLVLIYRDKNRAARTGAERRGSKEVIMEIVVRS